MPPYYPSNSKTKTRGQNMHSPAIKEKQRVWRNATNATAFNLKRIVNIFRGHQNILNKYELIFRLALESPDNNSKWTFGPQRCFLRLKKKPSSGLLRLSDTE